VAVKDAFVFVFLEGDSHTKLPKYTINLCAIQ
jgi:hypothetical protein